MKEICILNGEIGNNVCGKRTLTTKKHEVTKFRRLHFENSGEKIRNQLSDH